VRAGGAVGALLAALLTASFNRPGAYIVAATSLFVSVILATQFSFAAFLRACWARLTERLPRLRTAWVHCWRRAQGEAAARGGPQARPEGEGPRTRCCASARWR
jgi:hypothetical protein